MTTSGPEAYDLQRFVDAQRGAIDAALAELGRGRKTSHWMWFVFPQIAGLGHSAMARRYAISSLGEARAYVDHPELGPRLRQCVAVLLIHGDTSARQIMGAPDDLKLRSSMTLFARAVPQEPLFAEALDRFFGGDPDPATLERLSPQ